MEKPKVQEKPKFKSVKTSRKVYALKLIKDIRTKVIGLKHGYIADEEFNELEKLISKF